MALLSDLQSLTVDWSNPISRGLVAYWVPAAGGMRSLVSGVADITSVNSGTILATPNGVGFGNTVANNTGFGTTPHNAAWKPTAAITILHCGSVIGAGQNAYGFSTENSSDGWGFYAVGTTTPHLFIKLPSGFYDNSVTINNVNLPTQVALTFDGSNVNYYSDAATFGFAGTGPLTQSTNPLTMGGDILGDTGIAGSCNYMGIWNRALTATEIQSLKADPFQFMIQPAQVVAPLIDILSAAVTTPRPVGAASSFFGWQTHAAVTLPRPVGAASASAVDYNLTSATTLPRPVAAVTATTAQFALHAAVTTPRPVGAATANTADFALHAALTMPKPVGAASVTAIDFALHANLTYPRPVGAGAVTAADYNLSVAATAPRPTASVAMNRALVFGTGAGTVVRPVGSASVSDKVGLHSTATAPRPQAVSILSTINFALTGAATAVRPIGLVAVSTTDYPITISGTAVRPVGAAVAREGATSTVAVTLPRPLATGSVGFNVSVFFFAQPTAPRPIGNASVTSHPFNATVAVTTPRPIGLAAVKRGATSTVAVTLNLPVAVVRLAEVVRGSVAVTAPIPVGHAVAKHGQGLHAAVTTPRPVGAAVVKHGQGLHAAVTIPRPVAAGAIRLLVYFTLGGVSPNTLVLGHQKLGTGVLGTTVYMPRPIAAANINFVRNTIRSNNLILPRPISNTRMISIRNGLRVFGIAPRPLGSGQEIVVHNAATSAATTPRPIGLAQVKRGERVNVVGTALRPTSNTHVAQVDVARGNVTLPRPVAASSMISIHNGAAGAGILARPVGNASVVRGEIVTGSAIAGRPIGNARSTVVAYTPVINAIAVRPIGHAAVRRGNSAHIAGTLPRPVAVASAGHIPFDLFASARSMRPIAGATAMVVDYPVRIAGTLPRPINLTRVKSISGFHSSVVLLRPTAEVDLLHSVALHGNLILPRPVGAATTSFNTVVDDLRSNAVAPRPWAVALVNPGNLSYGLKRPIGNGRINSIDYPLHGAVTTPRPISNGHINFIENTLHATGHVARPTADGFIENSGSKVSINVTNPRPIANVLIKYSKTLAAAGTAVRPIGLASAKHGQGLVAHGTAIRPIGAVNAEHLVGLKSVSQLPRPVAVGAMHSVNYKLTANVTLGLTASGRLVAKDYIVNATGQAVRPIASGVMKRGEKAHVAVTTVMPIASASATISIALSGNGKAVRPIGLAHVFKPLVTSGSAIILRPKAHVIVAERVSLNATARALRPIAQGVLVPTGGTVASGMTRMPIGLAEMETGTGLHVNITMPLPVAEGHVFNNDGKVYMYSKPVIGRPVGSGQLLFATTINKNPIGRGNIVTIPTGEISTVTVPKADRVIN